jgi:hypothetical protein
MYDFNNDGDLFLELKPCTLPLKYDIRRPCTAAHGKRPAPRRARAAPRAGHSRRPAASSKITRLPTG